MRIIYLCLLAFMAIIGTAFSISGFCGKDIILDDAYIKASKEEREKMDKKAYRTQSAILFLFLSALPLCHLLSALLHLKLFFYLSWAVAFAGVVYAIVSHYALKNKKG